MKQEKGKKETGMPKDSKMNAEVVKAKFGHTQALGMKRSNGKRCPAEAVWLEERT